MKETSFLMVLMLVFLQDEAIPPSLRESLDQKARAREEQVHMCFNIFQFFKFL